MKIALLILAHHNPDNLKRLVSVLDDPRFDIFIHIDAKASIEDFRLDTYILRHSALYSVPDRIRSRWGDISLFDAMAVSYRYAMSVGSYAWFITLSGEDYPVQANDTICDYLSSRNTDCIAIANCPLDIRYKGFFFWKLGNRRFVRALRKGLYMLGIKKRCGLIVNGKEWTICLSSQWNALTHASVQHILATLERHPEIRRYFKYSLAPDEMVIPTILYNAPPCANTAPIPDPLTVMTFEKMATIHFLQHNLLKDSSVTVYDEHSFDEIITSGKLFLRKVRTGKSDRLMALLDQYRTSGKHGTS